MEDPFVALLTHDMRELGLAANVDTARWEAVMKSENLYTEQWILAYEAAHQGWLPAETKYLNEDPFFGVLENVGVSFYSPPEDSGVGYVTLWTGGY